MLGPLETKLAALVGEHSGIPVRVGTIDTPAQGGRAIGVALSRFTAESGFSPSDTTLIQAGGGPRSRRVLPIAFEAIVDFRTRPAASGAATQDAAHAALLDAMAAVAFLFGDPEVQTGKRFAPAEEDGGFRVLRFGLAAATAAPGMADDLFAGRIEARGQALVWPVGVTREEGVIAAVDSVVAPLPVAIRVAKAAIRPGQTTTVTVELGTLARGSGPTDLALTVLGDVPPASRGTLPDAPADPATGVALLRVDDPRAAIRYRAPDQDPGAMGRTEYLAIHLAAPDGKAGIHLGSAAIRLLAAP